MANQRFKMPNQEELKKAIKKYNFASQKSKITLSPIPDKKDEIILKEELDKTLALIGSAQTTLNEKEKEMDIMLNTESHLLDMKDFYKKHSNQLEKDVYNIKNSEDINKRLIEFYSKGYDTKKYLKKYLKYIYYAIVLLMTMVIIYKKLHKNKKVLAFLLFIIIFPMFILRRIIDVIMGKVGHFKLDILYTFFLVVLIGIGIGGFKLVKKLIQIIITPVKPKIN